MGTYTAGTTTTYTIVVANGGPTNVAGATVVDNIPAGGSITYTVILTIPAGFTGNLVNTATVTPPAGTTDPTPGNNSATDSDTPACVAVVTACPQGGTLTCAQAQAFVNDPAGLFAFLGSVITVTPANCGTVNITDNFNSTSICGGTFSVTFTITFTRNDSEPIVVSTTQCAQPFIQNHKWLRLDRTGNVFNMFSSPDGVAWSFLGTVTVAMNQCILIGVFAEGINQTTSTTCVMDNIMINTGTPVIPPPFGSLVQFDDQEVLDETGIGLTPDIRLYPNPASNDQEVTMELVGILQQKVRVSIYSLQGVLIKTIWVDGAEATTTNLDVSDFPDGVYLVNMLTEDKQSVSKMLRVVQQ